MNVRIAIGCLALCGCALIDAAGSSDPGDGVSIPGTCSDPNPGTNGCRISDCNGRLTLDGSGSSTRIDRVSEGADVVVATVEAGTLSIQQVASNGAPAPLRQLALAPAAVDAPIAAFEGGLVGYAFIASDFSITVALSDAANTGGAGTNYPAAQAFGKLALIETSVDQRVAVVWADPQTMTLRAATVIYNLGAAATITGEVQLATLTSLPTNPADFELETASFYCGNSAIVVWTEGDAGEAFFVNFDPISGGVPTPKTPATTAPAPRSRPRVTTTPSAGGGALITYISSNNDLTARRIPPCPTGTLTNPMIVAAISPPDDAALVAIDSAVIAILHGPGNAVRLHAMTFDGIAARGVEMLPLIPQGGSCGPVAALSNTSQAPAVLTYGRCDDNKREVDRLFCPGS